MSAEVDRTTVGCGGGRVFDLGVGVRLLPITFTMLAEVNRPTVCCCGGGGRVSDREDGGTLLTGSEGVRFVSDVTPLPGREPKLVCIDIEL